MGENTNPAFEESDPTISRSENTLFPNTEIERIAGDATATGHRRTRWDEDARCPVAFRIADGREVLAGNAVQFFEDECLCHESETLRQ